MIAKDLRKKFLDFFKKNGHKIVSSSSLISDDPSVLLTTAGMQQFVPYLEGRVDPKKDFGSRELVSVQKCFRTPDIDDVGDDVHHTFFEMLGNWSIGGKYFKEGAIKYALEFFEKELKLDRNRFWATIFKGEQNIPRDKESFKIWQEQGIPKSRIKEFGMADNFWGPTANTGPCGPCSEIHYDRGKKHGCGLPAEASSAPVATSAKGAAKAGKKSCGPNCNCNRFVELWNLVFMEYRKNEKGKYEPLPQKNIDTGAGLERILSVLQKKDSSYETDLFYSLITKIEAISEKKYEKNKKSFRIIADHIRGSAFLIADGVLPSNVEQGYILRRILRRAIRYSKLLNMPTNWYVELVKEIIKIYGKQYPKLTSKQADILTVIEKEDEKFSKALDRGLKEFDKILKKSRTISGKDAFWLYETYGFPFELTSELAREKGIKLDEKDFEKEFKKHQEISRAGAKKKFGGHGISETGEVMAESAKDKQKIIRLHTATHLLHQALRNVLGNRVRQMGSDINPERLRFDFTHPQKMTDEEIKKVENIVNKKIKEDLPVTIKEMPYKEAIKSGALAFFRLKYPSKVKVYSINAYSKEVCGGPHVKKTGEIAKFRITKEEGSGAGVRRIKAVVKE